MSTGTVEAPTKGKLKHIPLDLIREHHEMLRKVDKKSEKYHAMVNSVKNDGVINPIAVRELRDPENGQTYYGIIEGLHRVNASRDAGLTEIPAHIKSMSEGKVLETQIIGNIHRIETKPGEYSKQLLLILSQNPTMTVADMANRLSKSEAWVRQRLALTNLPDHVLKLLDDGKIVLSNAKTLADLHKHAPNEVNEFLDRAQTLPTSEFTTAVTHRIKAIRDAKRTGDSPKRQNEFVAVPFLQKQAAIKDEFANPKVRDRVLQAMNATTPETAWAAAIAWVVNMDPLSQQVGKERFEAEKKANEEAKEKRKKEREAQNQKNAAENTQAAVNA